MTYFSPLLSAMPTAIDSIIPLRNGTTVERREALAEAGIEDPTIYED